jgi:hypothetical protein
MEFHFNLKHATDPAPIVTLLAVATPAATAPAAVPQIARPVTSTPNESVPAAPAVVTPLALTPARDLTTPAPASNSSPGINVGSITTTGHDAFVAPAKASADDAAPLVRMPAQIASIVPPVFSVVRVMGAVPTAAQVVVAQVTDAVPVVAGLNVLASHSIEQTLPAQVAYNFIRFDAAAFHDAVSVFAADLASLTTPTAAKHSTARAWIITGTVLGIDALFVAYWHNKTLRQKRALQAALARANNDPRKWLRPQD